MSEERELNFTQFYPLDHRIGSRYCRTVDEFPTAPKGWGNIIRHARIWYTYVFDWTPRKTLHHVLCRFGRHDPGVARSRPTVDDPWDEFFACRWCGRRLTNDLN